MRFISVILFLVFGIVACCEQEETLNKPKLAIDSYAYVLSDENNPLNTRLNEYYVGCVVQITGYTGSNTYPYYIRLIHCNKPGLKTARCRLRISENEIKPIKQPKKSELVRNLGDSSEQTEEQQGRWQYVPGSDTFNPVGKYGRPPGMGNYQWVPGN